MEQEHMPASGRSPVVRTSLSLFMAVLLASCGGGGGGTSSPSVTSQAPIPVAATPASTIVIPQIVVDAGTPPEVNSDQLCSFIEAIVNANTDASTYSDCAPGSGTDTIVLPADSTQVFTTVDNSTFGPTGIPVITSSLTIKGNGSHIVRDSSAPSFRLFAVSRNVELRIDGLQISGGASVQFGDPSQSGGIGYGSPSQGGGILNYGTLVISNSSLSGNTSFLGGGAVHSEGGVLLVTDSSLTGNMSEGAGGAISQVGNIGAMMNSECSDNTAVLDGGCMWAGASSSVTVTNSLIHNNYGKAGGGLRAEWNTQLVVSGCVVTGNRAWGRGGGVSNGAHATVMVLHSTLAGNSSEFYGGGVLAAGSFTLVKNSTISGNSAPRGGGIATGSSGTTGGAVKVVSSTVTLNEASDRGGGIMNIANKPFVMSHVLVVGNTAQGLPSEAHDGSGSLIADRYNLFGSNGDPAVFGFTAGSSDIVGAGAPASILASELRDNGGSTPTHALIVGSQAIDAGDPRFSNMEHGKEWMYDQRERGFNRIDEVNDLVDIGSFEFQ